MLDDVPESTEHPNKVTGVDSHPRSGGTESEQQLESESTSIEFKCKRAMKLGKGPDSS